MTMQSQSGITEKLQDPAGKAEAEPVVSPEDRTQRIAVAAYHRAEQRGFTPDGELEDWLEAEKQIDADLVAESETTSAVILRVLKPLASTSLTLPRYL